MPGANPTRLENMMKTLGISGRSCSDPAKVLDVYKTPIDYNEVDKHLKEERRKFDEFFEKAKAL